MPINLHYVLPSPPSRAVMIVAKQLGIQLNLINVDLMKGAHRTPEFEKLNPRMVIPVIEDNGFVLGESRAIMTYMVNKYAPGHKLYPIEAKKRAQIDRTLYLTAELWERSGTMRRPVIRDGKWPVPEEPKQDYFDLLKALELLAAGKKFLAGEEMSLADISFICDLTTIRDVLSVDISAPAPGIAKWAERMKTELPEYDEFIAQPVAGFRKFVDKKCGINRD